MSNQPRVYEYRTMRNLINRLRDDLNNVNFVLLFAYNGTGKTRISMAFKEKGKTLAGIERDTLYFNAFTEDLFHWDNDLEGDAKPHLKINSDSRFFSGFKELALEDKIREFLYRYADFDFTIDYDDWTITFSRGDQDFIKVSRDRKYDVAIAQHDLCPAQQGAIVSRNFHQRITAADQVRAIGQHTDIAFPRLRRFGKVRIGGIRNRITGSRRRRRTATTTSRQQGYQDGRQQTRQGFHGRLQAGALTGLLLLTSVLTHSRGPGADLLLMCGCAIVNRRGHSLQNVALMYHTMIRQGSAPRARLLR